jgi:hypothetical protein
MKYQKYLYLFENTIQTAVVKAYPTAWDEDHITFSIVQKLYEQLRDQTIEGLTRPFTVQWTAFKATGKLEHNHGDLAVLVRYKSWESEILEGVGYLEAKRIYPRHDEYERYDAFNSSQLRRINDRTNYPLLLLYDYRRILDFADSLLFQPFISRPRSSMSFTSPFTHAVVVQGSLVLELNDCSRRLHKYSMPLSHQICARFLQAKDLDFDRNSVEAAKGNRGSDLRRPSYLLVANVSAGNADSLRTDDAKINSGSFELFPGV